MNSNDNSIIISSFGSLGFSGNTVITLSENIDTALSALSDKNRKQYESTFYKWQEYAIFNGSSALEFDLTLVRGFLTDNNWSFNTRKVRLAHLRKFAEILSVSDKNNEYSFAYNFNRLSLLKPKSLGGKKSVLKTKGLGNRQVFRLFDAVAGSSNKNLRDSAILALMLLCGLRSSEVVSLKWDDIQYDNNTLFIRDGKGGKSAHVPMLGDTGRVLNKWQSAQKLSGIYDFVVCVVWRSDKLGKNWQCTTRVISSLVKNLNNLTGIKFNPHDTRRTAITALLKGGASVADTRDFARHSNGETTLRYAQSSDASKLSKTLFGKLKYGDVLGAETHSDSGRYWECSNGHKFNAVSPEKCTFADCDGKLSHQVSMFDD